MMVRQLMQKDLVTIQSTSSIQEAAKKMKEHNVGTVLVTDEGSRLRGILTDRDITMAVAADARDHDLCDSIYVCWFYCKWNRSG